MNTPRKKRERRTWLQKHTSWENEVKKKNRVKRLIENLIPPNPTDSKPKEKPGRLTYVQRGVIQSFLFHYVREYQP